MSKNKKEKDKDETKPSIPICKLCGKPLLHCSCSSNELKK